MAKKFAKEDIFLNEDGKAVGADADSARFLLARKGKPISDEQIKDHKISKSKLSDKDPRDEEEKAQPPAGNKAVQQGDDK